VFGVLTFCAPGSFVGNAEWFALLCVFLVVGICRKQVFFGVGLICNGQIDKGLRVLEEASGGFGGVGSGFEVRRRENERIGNAGRRRNRRKEREDLVLPFADVDGERGGLHEWRESSDSRWRTFRSVEVWWDQRVKAKKQETE